jgi:hypothetical protein
VKLDKLGVQYPLNDQTSDWISAQQTIGGQTVASLSSRKLIEAQLNYVNGQKTPPVEAMTQCAVERSPLGHLDMYMKNNLPKTVGAGADWAAFFSAQQSKGFVADLSDRYVMYTHQQSACSDNNTVAQLQTQLSGNDTVKALLKTLTLIK